MLHIDFDTIDYRADKEILELLSLAIFKYQMVKNRKVPKRLTKKFMAARARYMKYVKRGQEISISVIFAKDEQGNIDFTERPHAFADIVPKGTDPEEIYRQHEIELYGYSEDEDDEDDDYDYM